MPTRSILVLCFATFALSACETAEQSAVVGGLTGAALGAAVSSDEDRTTGALAGAAVGVAASTLIGPSTQYSDRCIWRNQYGERYYAPCP